MGNTVDKDNFNDTCRGYVLRALKVAKQLDGEQLSIDQEETVLSGLRWAFDELTMSEARNEKR